MTNAASRSILADLLTAQGAQVIAGGSTATEAKDEIYGATTRPAQRDPIVLLDSRLPMRGGFEVGSPTRPASGPDRPATRDDAGHQRLDQRGHAACAQSGNDNYIVKPVRRAELFAAVARARAGVAN